MITASPVASTSRRSTVAPSTAIVLFGHLAWLGFVWLVATVIYAIVIASVALWGSVDSGLWQSVVATWQQFVIFAAGVTITTTFLRMLVRNGVTRRAVSQAAVMAGAGLALLVSVWLMAGYAVERAVYDANGWPQTLNGGATFTWGDLPRIGAENALVVATYYAAGWVVGACFYRWGAAGGLVRLLPALVPVVLIELVVSPDFGGAEIGVFASWSGRPPVIVTAAAGAAIVAATSWVARRLTIGTALR